MCIFKNNLILISNALIKLKKSRKQKESSLAITLQSNKVNFMQVIKK